MIHTLSIDTRKFLLPLHLWSGLTLGLLLIVMATSGALLVYRSSIDQRIRPEIYTVTPGSVRLPADELVARARVAHPSAELESVRFYGDATAPFLVYYTNKEYVHLNPYTGAVLGIRKRYGEGMGWVEGMHKFFQLEPSIGEPITGYTALVFGFIIVSGIVLWWPATRRALKAGLTINPKLSGRPWNLSLHKAIGIYAALVLLLSVVTGVPISLDWAKNSLYVLTGSKKVLPPQVLVAGGRESFAGFTAAAQSLAAAMPRARETYIPLAKNGVVAAYVIEAHADHPIARSYVWLESASAKVLKISPYADAGAGFRFYYWGMALHTGVMGGWVMQILLLLGSLAVPVLAYTGLASYLKRKKGHRAAGFVGLPR